MEDLFSVGVITTAHGVHGEVKVFPTTDDVRRFKKLKEVLLETKNGNVPRKVEGVKFFKQFVIVKLEGINTMDDALLLKNKTLYVTRENAVKCEKDEYFIADLIDISVIDDKGENVGILKEVYQTGANDVYEIATAEGETILLPAIKDCILDVDVNARIMKVHIMEGLL